MKLRFRGLTVVLALLILLSGFYLLRWPLMGGLIESMVRERAEEMGLHLALEGFSGSLLGSIRIGRLDAEPRDERVRVRALQAREVVLEYTLWNLLQGDWAALSLRMASLSLDLDLDRPGWPPQSPDEDPSIMTWPEALPALSLADGSLCLRQGSHSLALESLRFNFQESGSLRADRLVFVGPEGHRVEENLLCPLVYEPGEFRLGPLALERGTNLFEARLSRNPRLPGETLLKVKARPFQSHLSLNVSLPMTSDQVLKGDLILKNLDLASCADWLEPFALPGQPLAGILSLEGHLEESLEDPSTLSFNTHLELTGSLYSEKEPLLLDLQGKVREGLFSLARGMLQGENSHLTVNETVFDSTAEELSPQWLQGKLAFRIDPSDRWFGLLAEHLGLPAETARNALTGEGHLARGIGHLNYLRLDNEPDFLLSGSVRLFPELQADLNLQGMDPKLLARWLPPQKLPLWLHWQGLDLALTLKGEPAQPTGQMRVQAGKVRCLGIATGALDCTVQLTEDRLLLEPFHLDLAAGGMLLSEGLAIPRPGKTGPLTESIDLSLLLKEVDLASLETALPESAGLQGTLSTLEIRLNGLLENPDWTLFARGSLDGLPGRIQGSIPLEPEPLYPLAFGLSACKQGARLDLEFLELLSARGEMNLAGSTPLALGLDTDRVAWDVSGEAPISAFLQGAGLDFPLQISGETVQGLTDFEAVLEGTWAEPEARVSGRIREITGLGPGPHELNLNGTVAQGRVTLEALNLSHGEQRLLHGSAVLDLNSSVDQLVALPGPESRLVRAVFELEETAIGPYATALGYDLEGLLQAKLEGEGLLSDPVFCLGFNLREGRLPLDREKEALRYSLRGKEIVVKRSGTQLGELEMHSSLGSISGSGEIPMGVGWDRPGWIDGSAPLKGRLTCSEVDLSLPELLPLGMRRMAGRLTGEAQVSGTLTHPDFLAELTLKEGALRWEGRLSSFEEIEASLQISPDRIKVNSLDCMVGGGPVQVQGEILWSDFIPEAYDLALSGQQALLYRDRGVRLRGDLKVALKGPASGPLLSGEVILTHSRVVRHIPLLPGRGPAAVEEQIQLFSLTDPFGKRLLFDLAILTREGEAGLQVNNNLLQGTIRSDLRLEGTGEVPFLIGTALFDGMALSLPNFNFLIDQGRLSFSRTDPFTPRILFTARGRRQSHDVDLLVQGTVTDPEITLVSSPPLDESSLLVLVTTGSLPETIRQSGMENEALMQVGTYLGKELIRELFGNESTETEASFVERFNLMAGTEVSSEGTPNVVLEYQLEGPWFIQIERDVYRDANIGFVYRIHFR